jgi:hypothetical protein
MEQVKGIEPSQSAWKADVLPLNYTCILASSSKAKLSYIKKAAIASKSTKIEGA